MQISLLNEMITFQRNVILTDRIGNHMSSWNDEFSCYATIGGESGKETAVVGTTVENADITFGDIGFVPRPVALRLDSDILQIIENLKTDPENEFHLHIGPMACGNSVVANRDIVNKQIHSLFPKTAGLDMESYSVFYAATYSSDPKPKAIVIKSICDYADAEKSDKYQKFAAYTSSRFAKYLFENHLPF